MVGVWPPKVSIVYGLWIQLILKQVPKCFWNCLWKYSGVFSKQLA